MYQDKIKLPAMFWVIAVFALLWNALGLIAYLSDMFISSEAIAAMEPDMQRLHTESPIYQKIVYGLAVFSGVLGSIGLLLRKSWAVQVFALSLVCVILQLIISIAATNAFEILGLNALILPSVVILIAAFLFWHSRNAHRSGQIA